MTTRVEEVAEIEASRTPAARWALIVGPVLAVLAFAFAPADQLAIEARLVLGLTVLMAAWWITEAIPLPVTALLPIIALPLFGIEVARSASGAQICATAGACAAALPATVTDQRILTVADLGLHYSNPVVLLYIGGFSLGVALERWGLTTRIAYGVVARGGANPKLMLAGFLLAAAFISAWISNTSTALILTPLALSMAAGASPDGRTINQRFAGALTLGVCYASTIGGLTTPIGTPTNGIALQQLRTLGIEVSFGEWLAIGVPAALILLPIAWLILSWGVTLNRDEALAAQARVRTALKELGPLSAPEARVLAIFAATAVLWVFSAPLADWLGPNLLGLEGAARLQNSHLDTIIATIAALALFLTPAGRARGRALMTWEDAQQIPWGIILLFGGGLALAAGAELSGLTAWIAQALRGVAEWPPVLLIAVVALLVIVITEFASNVATISLMGPVLVSLAAASDHTSPAAFIVPAALAASVGFAMPVGSGPNAIAFATNTFTQGAMIRRGLLMNLAALIVLTIVGMTIAPAVLGGR